MTRFHKEDDIWIAVNEEVPGLSGAGSSRLEAMLDLYIQLRALNTANNRSKRTGDIDEL